MSKEKVPMKELCKRWIHSYEEDTDSEVVYRSAGFNFPPARGRTGFELRPDYGFSEIGIAPTDGSVESEGTWELDTAQDLKIRMHGPLGASRVLPVLSVGPNRLVVRKKAC